MTTHEPSHPHDRQEAYKHTPAPQKAARRRRTPDVTEARSQAQRAKLDAQTQTRLQQEQSKKPARQPKKKTTQEALQAKRRAGTTITRAIDDYLQDHDGGNSSAKTLEWHRTSLGLLQRFLEAERDITLIGEVNAPAISAWFAHMRKTPSTRGKVRSERTIQTYARSVRAFFHWLVRRETIERNPFDRIVFPKVGRPLIQTIEPEEFEQLLQACVPPTRQDLSQTVPLYVIVPSSGCSTIPVFASPNCVDCAWVILIADTG